MGVAARKKEDGGEQSDGEIEDGEVLSEEEQIQKLVKENIDKVEKILLDRLIKEYTTEAGK